MKKGTIFAPATASGRAGIGVIRVSGELALNSLDKLSVPRPLPRTATRALLTDYDTLDIIDDAIIIWFPKPQSFTGEDVVEFHIHGGSAVMSCLLESLGRIAGFRFSDPGEFTRRAFENQKMDLTAAEGLADLIDAETKMQRKQALRQMSGGLENIYDGWRKQLVKCLSYIEAVIDFSDEDIPSDLLITISSETKNLISNISNYLADNERGERVRDGIHIAIVGEPNVGKSSLINALAKRDIAIVSELPGTTRDIIEINLNLGGFSVILSDTAGLRDSSDDIESEGIRRALLKAKDADFRIIMYDRSQQAKENKIVNSLAKENSIFVYNKSDLYLEKDKLLVDEANKLLISAKTGQGIDNLIVTLTRMVEKNFTLLETASISRSRHRVGVLNCLECLNRSWDEKGTILDIELLAEEIRLAIRALEQITGRVNVEDVLDKIFSDFCIGK